MRSIGSSIVAIALLCITGTSLRQSTPWWAPISAELTNSSGASRDSFLTIVDFDGSTCEIEAYEQRHANNA